MNIFNFMNQKLTAAKKGQKTGMNFPYLNRLIKKFYLN